MDFRFRKKSAQLALVMRSTEPDTDVKIPFEAENQLLLMTPPILKSSV